MTRTQTRAYGVRNPSGRQLLLEAMLCVFAWLVSNVASMLATIFNRHIRDWHTDEAQADQLPTPNDITQKAPQLSQPSFSRKAAGRIPGIQVASTQGTTTHSLDAAKQDARDKPEHDTVGIEPARHSLLSFRAKAHSAADPESMGGAHSLSSRRPHSGNPGPIRPHSESANGSQLALALGRDDKDARTHSLI